MIGNRIGRFQVLEKLGEGGMATVWKAHDTLLDRTVALKTLAPALAHSPESRRRFHHEAEVASSLDHPGIAAIYATGEERGTAYLAMAFIEGETLSERLAKRLIPIPDAIQMVCVAAAALGYAHARGVVHRDVTSRNIMLAEDGRVFVLDFGLATAAGISRITSRNTTVGTIAYMAPELLAGAEADARSDVYGLGVVLYEALTGALPFLADAPEVLKYAALNQEPRSPRALRPEISRELERIVLKAIARDPAARYASADEMMRDLHDAATTPGAAIAAGRPLATGTQRLREGDPVHLAVLPIELPDIHPEDEDGMRTRARDDLVAVLSGTLAHAGHVHVVMVAETFAGASDAQSLRAYARREGVHLLLRGALRRDRSQLRFTYSLIDAEAGVQIGGGTVGGAVTEMFDFEDRVVRDVRRALGLPGAKMATPPPHDPAAADRYAQARAYLKRSDVEASVDGAITLLERLSASEPATAAYPATLARAYLMKYEHAQERIWENKAAEALERARNLDANDPDVHLATGWLMINGGKPEAALEAFAEARGARPDDYDTMLGTAHGLVLCGQMEEAEKFALRCTATAPQDWRGYGYLAWVRIRRGNVEGAIEPRLKVVELAPDSERGYRNLGTAYYRLSRFDEAIDAYEKALALLPHRETYSNLGTALYHLGRYERAVAVFRKACELAPADPVCWGNLGNACFNLAREEDSREWSAEAARALDTAITLMKERLERNPGVPEWWARLASWLGNRDRKPEARTAIDRALSIAPEDADSLAQAGYLSQQFGDTATALDFLKRAVRAGYPQEELTRSLVLRSLHDDPGFVSLLEPRERDSSRETTTGRPDHDVPGVRKEGGRA